MEMRVSMVAVPWRRLVQAALWNGQAAHTITGAARAREAHCQEVNWSAGTMAMAITGTVSTIAPMRRCLSDVSSESGASPSLPGGPDDVASLGLGMTTVYT